MNKIEAKKLIGYLKDKNIPYEFSNNVACKVDYITVEADDTFKRFGIDIMTKTTYTPKTYSYTFANHVFGFEYKKNVWAWFEIDNTIDFNLSFTHLYNRNNGCYSKNKKGVNSFLYKNFNCFAF